MNSETVISLRLSEHMTLKDFKDFVDAIEECTSKAKPGSLPSYSPRIHPTIALNNCLDSGCASSYPSVETLEFRVNNAVFEQAVA